MRSAIGKAHRLHGPEGLLGKAGMPLPLDGTWQCQSWDRDMLANNTLEERAFCTGRWDSESSSSWQVLMLPAIQAEATASADLQKLLWNPAVISQQIANTEVYTQPKFIRHLGAAQPGKGSSTCSMKRTYHQGNRANSLITKETENLYLYCFGGIREVSLYRILKDSCELKPSNYEKNLLEILVMKKK